MKLQQLRYILEVAKHNLNVSQAAEALFTSQPGISKQIKLLEEELNVQIFIRRGKRVVGITEPGHLVLQLAERILNDTHNIKQIGAEFAQTDSGTLAIATTHTQARYALPKVVSQFLQDMPQVQLIIKQGSPKEITEFLTEGIVDFAILTESFSPVDHITTLPCGEWNRSVIVPQGHPLSQLARPLTLHDLTQYPLITYDFAFHEGSHIAKAFAQQNVPEPRVALSAVDTDVIKTYVRLNLGVGLIATMAYEAQQDSDLVLLSAAHLFEPSSTKIALRNDAYLRGYAYHFIELFAPSLTKARVEQMLYDPVIDDFSI
ncbi:MAG: CysB family HTH-type transcriptional regulator [Neisseriaceae bacterium]|nr:CysB family HTH-type transcriptional regulator [Neisseriaceae bacterium]MBP6862806.1 CysB family HTH-type transcriptional regulator [Neisseriaceae bacterium]